MHHLRAVCLDSLIESAVMQKHCYLRLILSDRTTI